MSSSRGKRHRELMSNQVGPAVCEIEPTQTLPAVLVAEDHEDSRCMFKCFLESRGYRVVEAGDGREAISAAERERPDLVVMDASLPLLDGFETTRRLRAQEPLCGLPIVMVSGYATPADRENALAAGCSDYLTKPLELEQLARVLERHLVTRAAQRRAAFFR